MNIVAKIQNPNNELTIVKEALETCGAVTYFRASGDVSIGALSTAWQAAGLDEKLLRKAPDPKTLLRRAVLRLADRKKIDATTEIRTLVRPCAEAHTWAVVREVVTEGELPRYTTLLTVMYDNGPQFGQTDDAPVGGRTYETFKERILTYVNAGEFFDPSDITGWLVKLAYANGAVTLRDSGGVYFLPRPAMGFWNAAASVIESVTNGRHRVFRIPAMKNTEAIAAITDAITAEAEQIVNAIDTELAATGDDKLGKRALESRITEAATLLAKVESYEKLVEERITVKDKVEALQAALAAAALA